MSLDNFRFQVLSSLNGEERVEVNQRLLIDKILARYSAEFVVYRELMQNSDDASSQNVQIIFETTNKVIRDPSNPPKRLNLDPSIEDNKMEDKITRIIFRNNGFAFRTEDWNRLKKIAEGNPDEQKIGAFGVGFYSLFSVCEEPFVSSGGQGMAFYWRGNQLFAKQAPTGDNDRTWTTFLMDMREPLELPNIEKFARFLANSLGFTGNLRDVSVYFNDSMVIQLSKGMADPILLNTASGFNVSSPRGIFHLTSMNIRRVQLNIKRLVIPTNMNINQWSSLPISNLQIEQASIFLRIANGNMNVKVTNEISAEMDRITKKKPPSKTTIQMIYTGFDEYGNYNKNISSVFKDLLPYPGQGRIYIGFPTHQTTGCCAHLAARVIPTVERESIDLVEKTLSIYNGEMLRMAGTLCRILYENEIAQISGVYSEKILNNTIDDETKKSVREYLENWAIHALTHFTFKLSTPNAQVGGITESQFFNCSKNILPILSTNGVLPITNVRIPNSEMAGFIKTIPFVPKIIFEQCYIFFRKVKNMNLIKELTLDDVLYELDSRTLSEDEITDLLKWWISYRSKETNVNATKVAQFLQFARIDDNSRSLNKIRYFLNPGIVPPDVDVPAETLPFVISKKLKSQDLEKWVGWSELSLINWARFIVNKPELENDPTFAKKVLQILGKSLNNLSKNDKNIIQQLFIHKRCIPTKFGMKKPNESYFNNVNLFPDLPTIEFQKPTNIMEHLGVRKVVELKLIFDRLVSQGNWDHMQLAKYLASMSNNLKENEIKILKDKPIWPKELPKESSEESPKGSSSKRSKKSASKKSSKGSSSKRSNKDEPKEINPERFIARQLYTPLALHREFGLPLLEWKGNWNRNSQEGKFIIGLGLQEYPTLKAILELAAFHSNLKIRSKALKYFIDNFEDKYSKDYDPHVNIAFLPCLNPGIYVKPSECHINVECTTMKFYAISQDLRFQVERLGVCQNPSHEKLLMRLREDPPRNENKAKDIFEYLASRQADFTENDWKILTDLEFIPIKDKCRPDVMILTSPRNCFFNVQDDLKIFFTCIDFGIKANRFLTTCGVKNEPSPVEHADLLVRLSTEVYNSLASEEKYLSILRNIAFNLNTIKKARTSLIAEMRKSPILIGIKKNNNNGPDSCCLDLGKKIFVNDNSKYQRVFKPLTAPVDNDYFMKILYSELGCRSLHETVQENVRPIGISKTSPSPKAQELQAKIIERASLFYFEHPNIKKNVDWLKMLKVKDANYMETTFVLDNDKKVERRSTTSCILQDTLYITANPDSLDVADNIVKNIYAKYEWKDVFCVNVLLTAELSSLKRRGYPVDHIMQQQNYRYVRQQSAVNNKKTIKVTPESIRNLRNSLRNSIISCNSNIGNINSINNQADIKIVDESQASYCDIIPGHLLFYVGTIREIKLYDTRRGYQSEIMSSTHIVPLNHFIDILRDLAEVFELLPKVIHVFYDDNSNTIAFNRDGALFFNLKFYIGLHEEECKVRPTNDVMTYWFMTFCHELAHNFVELHSSEHEYYYSSFSETYMSNFISMIKRRGIIW
ncbi:hypothetical protein C1645_812855 [Glomus cerebriforme]|uniref:Sacsin/Nov domain-containing protein n=1 Tax=Glomus cerebriforme TaxID=658196 RepID=A0A397TTS2_9GLOM|nr:hypothetical protein C1645_812855 [Glomus cerebriforme]